ncbi:MAG: FG-GAP repeat protein [Chloroflexi bacterium]|nr:FG-GAP repeat protein [Chloroflexota bacterium]MBI3731894.1 FG-GAP repeat protein [Chloroflexota bacterium]
MKPQFLTRLAVLIAIALLMPSTARPAAAKPHQSGPVAFSWMAEGDQAGAQFGRSVNSAGDVNGDGYADVIVGAPYYSNGQPQEGKVSVYYGSATGLSKTANWTAEGNDDSAQFGFSAGTAGDVNCDGYADIIVGAQYYWRPEVGGKAYVYYGSANGLSATPNWVVQGDQYDARVGGIVGTAGDVNGDGCADVIVSAHAYDTSQKDGGRVYVYYGSHSGLSTTPNWIVDGNQYEEYFGQWAGAAGDVNGDGYADILVGAYWYDNGQTNEGKVYLYYGSPTGLSTTPAWTAEGNQANADFGLSVGTACDVNGDGYADILIVATQYDHGQTDEGRAYVYYGSPSGPGASPNWTFETNQAYAKIGFPMVGAGDVNGDGYTDVIIGSDGYDSGQTDEGKVFLFYGSANGLSKTPVWTAEGNQDGAGFGISAGTAGDVNGDGYADLIVGAYLYDDGQSDEGAAFAFYGSANGLPVSTMHIASINPFYKVSGNQYQVGTTVVVQDASGAPVDKAQVTIQTTQPDGNVFSIKPTTDSSGTARMAFYTTLHGTFTFTVTGVIKTGWAYDPAQNVETSDSITIP